MILEDRAYIQPTSLFIEARASESAVPVAVAADSGSFDGNGMSLLEQEHRLLVQALERTGGNQSQAAHLLKITRYTLRYKMKKFGLN
jgi:DNA-binding NtrC family response regulator